MTATPFLPLEVWEAIKPTFIQAYPSEGIVAVWPDLSWRALENVHPYPTQSFAISDADKMALEKRAPLTLIHSHPNASAAPSDLDSRNQLATGWTWGIVAIQGNGQGEVYSVSYPEFWGDEVPIPALEGRSYLWGIRDCYSLVRDYYRLEGNYLRDIPRARYPDDYPSGHWGRDPFRHWVPLLGFKPVRTAERKPGDLFTMKPGSNRPDHAGIYLGNGKYIHQPLDRCSEVDTFTDRLMERLSVQFFRR